VLISGRVQGVFFRQSLATEARSRGVTGWARNLPDGRVEAELQGDGTELEAVIRWCRAGPPGARVDQVESEDVPVVEEASFEVRW